MQQLEIREGSYLFKVFKKPPVDVIIKVYIFNVTNAAAFMSGKDSKLNVSEIGPYVFQSVIKLFWLQLLNWEIYFYYFREFVEHKNYTFHENGTLSYTPVRSVVPLVGRSIGNYMTDIVVSPNLPLLGLSSTLSEFSTIAALGLSALTKSKWVYAWNSFINLNLKLSIGHNAQPILNLTVHDYLWGYEDKLVKLASKLAPKVFNFEKFGIMDRVNDKWFKNSARIC